MVLFGAYVCFQRSLFAQGQPLTEFVAMNRTRGGFLQQLQQEGFPLATASSSRAPLDVRQEGRSKLALKLLERWCWGSMSLPVLQALASAAVEDGLTDPLLRCYKLGLLVGFHMERGLLNIFGGAGIGGKGHFLIHQKERTLKGNLSGAPTGEWQELAHMANILTTSTETS